jgi:hypothetical protein
MNKQYHTHVSPCGAADGSDLIVVTVWGYATHVRQIRVSAANLVGIFEEPNNEGQLHGQH